MQHRFKHAPLAALLGLALSAATHAAPPPPHGGPAAHGGPPALHLAPHLRAQPVVEGRVQRVLINPFGEVDGLKLDNGTIVRFAPHMGEDLAATAQPGQTVRVAGYASGYGAVRAYAISNTSSGQTVTDQGPPHFRGLPRIPPHLRMMSLQTMQTEGRIEAVLTGRRGEPNAVLLDNGHLVRFAPHSLTVPVQVGQPFAASGMGTRNQHGMALEAVSMGSSLSALQPLFSGVR